MDEFETPPSRGRRGGAVSRTLRDAGRGLPICALYPVAQLAHACGLSHKRMQSVLAASGVEIVRAGRCLYVPLSEVEEKVRPLWDGLRAAEMLRRGTD